MLSRYADVQAAARDHVTFTSARGTDLFDDSLGPGDFLDLDPPRHDELRRIARETLVQRHLAMPGGCEADSTRGGLTGTVPCLRPRGAR